MKLYHGSDCEVRVPDVSHSRQSVDFGRGFYLTSYEEQAVRWAQRKAMRTRRTPIVSCFELDEHALSSLRVRRFDGYALDWLDYVTSCRRREQDCTYDVVIGPVADDKVFRAVDMYLRELWDADTTLNALRFFERNDQYCFCTQEAIEACLAFSESWMVAR